MSDIGTNFQTGELQSTGLDMTPAADMGNTVEGLMDLEATSSFPPLPDEVRLDLVATPGFNATELVSGLYDDFRQINEPAPVRLSQVEYREAIDQAATEEVYASPTGGVFVPESDFAKRARKAVRDITGLDPDKVISADAVVELKREAIKYGLLDPETPLDGSWSPELSGMRAEIASRQYQQRISGTGRDGSLSVAEISTLLDDWASPGTLIMKALVADYIPDVQRIASETADWGEKWKKWWGNKSDVGNLLDAVTGPLDDALFPVLNIAMLGTGVGGLASFHTGLKLAKAGKAARATQVGLRGAKVVDHSAEIASFAEKGVLATRMAKSSNQSFQHGAQAMEAWRNTHAVMRAKKGIQVGMRQGLVTNVEDLIGDTEGIGITGGGSQEDRLIEFKNFRNDNPWTLGVTNALVDVSLTPRNILPLGSLAKQVARVRDIGQDFTAVAQDQATTVLADQVFALVEPAKYAEAEALGFRTPIEKIKHVTGISDDEQLGHMFSTMITSAAIDKEVNAQVLGLAALRDIDPSAMKGERILLASQSKAQLRQLTFDPTDVQAMSDYARTRVGLMAIADNKDARRRYAEIMQDLVSTQRDAKWKNSVELRDAVDIDSWDSFGSDFAHYSFNTSDEAFTVASSKIDDSIDEMREFIEHHNELRSGYMNMHMQNVEPEDIAMYMQRNVNEMKNWGEYTAAHTLIDEFVPDKAVLAQMNDLFSTGIERVDKIIGDMPIPKERIKSSALDTLWDEGIPAKGRMSLARMDTYTKQQKSNLLDSLKHMEARFSATESATEAQQLQHRLDVLGNQREMWEEMGIDPRLDMAEKIKQLSGQIATTAAEIDVPSALKKQLAQRGYKAVWASDTLAPADIAGLHSPLAEVTAWERSKRTFGMAFEHKDASAVGKVRELGFRQHLGQAAARLGVGDDLWVHPNGIDGVIEDLREIQVRAINVEGEFGEVAEGAGKINATLGRAMSVTPFSKFSISTPMLKSQLGAKGYSKEAIDAITESSAKAMNVGGGYTGLQNHQDQMIANAGLRNILVGLSKHQFGTDLEQAAKHGLAFHRNGISFGARRAHITGMQRVASGAVTGAFSYDQSGEDARVGIAGAAIGALGGKSVANPRSLARYLMAEKGYEEGGGGVQGLLVGGVAGAAGGAALRRGAGLAVRGMDSAGMADYSRLSKAGTEIRDRARFQLSFIWDAQRYTENAILGGTVLDEAAPITFSYSRSLRKKHFPGMDTATFRRDALPAIDAEFTKAVNRTKGLSLEVVEASQLQFMTDRGLAGFSPREQMASAFDFLRRGGLDADTAANQVLEAMTYGTKGRTPFELSINTVFFPFSFMKKYGKQVVQFAAKDHSRTVMMHDSLKVWDWAYEEYEIGEVWRDHIPVLGQMRKFNALAYGMSPGEFGGQSRALFETVRKAPGVREHFDTMVNAFLPQAWEVQSPEAFKEASAAFDRVAPLLKDVMEAYEMAMDQKRVISDPSHLSKQSQINKGYEEYGALRDQFEEMAAGSGRTLTSILSSQDAAYAEFQSLYKERFEALAEDKPAWAEARDENIQKSVDRNEDLKRVIAEPQNEAEFGLQEFSLLFDDINEKIPGDLLRSPELVSPDVYELLRRRAIAMAMNNKGFLTEYNTYYRRVLGPIETEVL